MRSDNLFSQREAAGLDAPEQEYAYARGRSAEGPAVGRDAARGADDYGDGFEEEFAGRARRPGVRLSFSGGLLPKTIWGRIAVGSGLLLLAGVGVAGLLAVRGFLLRDQHFTVESPASVQIAGNSHVTRAQLLSVFGEDVERNIFSVPLAQRRAELERLPWVAHATVMRLLPNRVRVAIVERTPVAFVRQGTEVGLVDAHGVLLDLPGAPDGADGAPRKAAEYSFPVLTGISAGDPLSTRAARMRIYLEFVAALDASGENISRRLSEVDLSNPEDVKAIVSSAAPRGPSEGSDILVHFGDAKFLERYRQYEQHLPEWRAQYPRLASVDMRYERQVVLEMQPGDGKGEPASAHDGVEKSGAAGVGAGAGGVRPTHGDKTAMDGAPGPGLPVLSAKAKASAQAAAPPAARTNSPVTEGAANATAAPHLTTAFAVGPGAAPPSPRPGQAATKAAAKPATEQGAPR